jgi:hypothetical protein
MEEDLCCPIHQTHTTEWSWFLVLQIKVFFHLHQMTEMQTVHQHGQPHLYCSLGVSQMCGKAAYYVVSPVQAQFQSVAVHLWGRILACQVQKQGTVVEEGSGMLCQEEHSIAGLPHRLWLH